MNEIFGNLGNRLIDLIIYGAVAICFILGMSKCVLPLRRAARLFRRAIHSLSAFNPQDGKASWQDSLFLGKPMQRQWSRFLSNAEQLDQRGLALDVEEYISDQTVLVDFARFQLAEVIPGLLTSLGILGTFVGLMRGLGGLDLSSADKTVASIHTMIAGMTFAYGTSIAGLVGSLLFNIFFRAAQGSATTALDDFNKAFADVVMQRPLDEPVRQTCYMEDQASFLTGAFADINQTLESGIGLAVERSFAPIGQSMHSFIMGQAQTQVEGLAHVVNQFVDQMNEALGGQFLQLGKTLSQLNQAQGVSMEAVNQTMDAASTIMQSIQETSQVSQVVMDRFEEYARSIATAQEGGADLARETGQVLAGMHQDVQRQNERYRALVDAQADLSKQMEHYAAWSGRVLEAVEKQSDAASDRAHEVANEMSRSSKLLADSYASFVENIATGLARTMSLFEENLRDISQQMVEGLRGSASGQGTALSLGQFNQVQQALLDMSQALDQATQSAQRLAAGGKGA